MDYQKVLEEIHQNLTTRGDKGVIASYIPELSKVNIDNFGIYLKFINEENYAVGDFDKLFSIQSTSKVFSLAMAFSLVGDEIWKRMDVEPSGNPFNHLSLLEQENGIPRNPLINSGAIVISDILLSNLKNPKKEFLNFIRDLASDDTINYNESVARSEKETGYKNYAIANLLKSFTNLENNVEDVLDFYFYQCAIEMNCAQLAKAAHFLANHGLCSKGKRHLSARQVKRINAIMLTCGFYDEAGEFAFEVGLPGKSGVGGGIIALLPNAFTIATWAPGLNTKGNSLLGMKALEQFTTMTKRSIF